MDRFSTGLLLGLGLAAAVPARAQNTSTIETVSPWGNYHAGGVVLTVVGDDNRNASATLQWRPNGSSGAFKTAQPLARVGLRQLVGSLFGLLPGRLYDVRVTLSDPDGVLGVDNATVSLRTRAEGFPEPTLRTLYVATNGDDSRPGTSPSAPLRTIQKAATLSRPGDLVLIAPGVYRETVTVPHSGDLSQPIVFRGNGAGVVLDGAEAALETGGAWAARGGGVFALTPGFATGHVASEQGRLFRYGSQAELTALAAGAPGGFFFDGTTLFVKMADGSSPLAHTMHVARREDGFLLDSVSSVRVENMEIRYFGAGDFGKGVYLRSASICAVRGCRIHDVGAAGVWVKNGGQNVIEDNELTDTSIFNWPWDLTKGSSAENNGVVFTDGVGQGNVVRRNSFRGTFNGIGPCGSSVPSGFSNETDVYDNTFAQHTDDALEPEGYCSNVRMWNNRIQDVHMAFAVAPAAPGPNWIVRNVAWRFGNTRTSQVDGYTASALKINSGYPDPIGPLFLFHNTFLTDAPATEALALLDPGESTYIRARNNLFAGTRYVIEKVNPVVLNFDGDDLYTTDGGRFVKWEGATYASLAALRGGTGQELQGLSVAPQLVSPAGANFQPSAGGPLVDKALPLPGINDLYRGAAADVGAFEVGSGFLDVPTSHPYYTWVEALVRRGVTGGCSVTPPLYCPTAAVTRDQMAVFLLRAKEGDLYTPPACTTPAFSDVPCTSPYARWVNELAARGITGGCGSGLYCPTAPVARDQMAVFLLRTLLGSAYLPPACTTPVFADVPCTSVYARWVNELAARGIAGGCGGGNYCPADAVTRGAMAVFLSVTFALP